MEIENSIKEMKAKEETQNKVTKRRTYKKKVTKGLDISQKEELMAVNYLEITKNTIDNIDLHMDCLQEIVKEYDKIRNQEVLKEMLLELENIILESLGLLDKLSTANKIDKAEFLNELIGQCTTKKE